MLIFVPKLHNNNSIMMEKKQTQIDFTDNETDKLQTGGLKERLSRVKTTRWVRFAIVSLVFFAWVAW